MRREESGGWRCLNEWLIVYECVGLWRQRIVEL